MVQDGSTLSFRISLKNGSQVQLPEHTYWCLVNDFHLERGSFFFFELTILLALRALEPLRLLQLYRAWGRALKALSHESFATTSEGAKVAGPRLGLLRVCK